MDLKDFIKETVSGIVNATSELQSEFESHGVVINPPVSTTDRDLYEHEEKGHRYRRVEVIEFDVAVTAASGSAGEAKAGLRIFSAEAGIDGKHSRNNEEVSRVRFAIPIVFSPARVEIANKAAAEVSSRKANDAAAGFRSRNVL